jgi:hypothetical protein
MKRLIAIYLFLLVAGTVSAQQYSLHGVVTDTAGSPIVYATVSLLKPEDSTLVFFGITNAAGQFEIKNMDKGNYLLQAAFLGFKPYYKKLEMPVAGNEAGKIVLKNAGNVLQEVEITSEKVPLMIKGDTVEYNSGAYKTKPDASVEELLKKLPGVEVDRSGNIKAQGEDVRKVLVDGKEFFGDDPKVATKNLPADAIKKVQVFNKKSDATEFTGIDDGTRDKTINLMLKDGKKSGYFGDVQAGYGTEDRYKFGGKLYQFRKKMQFAAIGLYNNINQPGFSFSDYLAFNGGVRSLLNGAGNLQFQLNGRNDLPVDFGQPVNGLIRSGAGGLNYSYEPKKNYRIALSYLGNMSNKDLVQQSQSVYSIPADYIKRDSADEATTNMAHRLNLSLRRDIDSTHQFTLYGNGALMQSKSVNERISTSAFRSDVLNRLDGSTRDNGSGINATARGSYLFHTKSKWPVIKLSGEAKYNKELTNTEWSNLFTLIDSGITRTEDQYRNDFNQGQVYSLNAGVVRSLGKGFYMEPSVNVGTDYQQLNRKQSLQPDEVDVIDSLSRDFSRRYNWVRPGINLQKSSSKKQLNIGAGVESGTMAGHDYMFILPSADWQNEYGANKRLNFSYNSAVNTPDAEQMMPVVNNANPVQRYVGNLQLRPEYVHNLRAGWLWFDQFSFTSLFTNISGRYTHDKIVVARTINSDLTQELVPVNTTDNYRLDGRVEFSRPVKKLKLNMELSVNESYERGISPVNGINNATDVFNHNLQVSFSNRKKEKWDARLGGSVELSDIKYSVNKNLDNSYNTLTAFTEISFRPTDNWNIMTSADLTQYSANSFSQSVTIPLVKAEVSYYFMKAKRGVLTLEGFDLLNQNKGLQRTGELNFYRETRSNVLGRYFLLSFKYRLNKLGSGGEKMDIKVNRR